MKRSILKFTAIIMTFAMIFALVGCSGKEEPLPDIVLSELYGTWKRNSNAGEEKYTFSKNMNYTKSIAGVFSKGTYSVSGSTLTLTPAEIEKPSEHTVQIKGNTMIWGTGSVQIEYKKQ